MKSMLWEWFKYRRSMARLDKAERELEQDRENARKRASEKGKLVAPDEESMFRHELLELYCERQWLESRHLMKLAWHYDVPRPRPDDTTAWDEDGGRRFLNTKARAELRASIRKERGERVELILRVLAIVVPATIGIIGAITGLVAVWYK